MDKLAYIKPTPAIDAGMAPEGIEWALNNFKVRDSDVMISTFPKTGTTVLTWMCHQIRTGGHFDFEDLYQIAPWILLSWQLGQDPNVDGSEFKPRIFKSHLRLASEFRGCKYLVTIRDPFKTTLSFYNFLSKKQYPIVLDKDLSGFLQNTSFMKGTPEGRPSIWEIYEEYYRTRDDPNVLVVVYEDLVKDMKPYIKLIASFMGCSITPELIEKVNEMCTKDFMAQHESKMNETWVHNRAREMGRSPENGDTWTPASRICKTAHTQTLDESGEKFLKENWDTYIGSKTGIDSYEKYASLFREINDKKLAQLSTS